MPPHPAALGIRPGCPCGLGRGSPGGRYLASDKPLPIQLRRLILAIFFCGVNRKNPHPRINSTEGSAPVPGGGIFIIFSIYIIISLDFLKKHGIVTNCNRSVILCSELVSVNLNTSSLLFLASLLYNLGSRLGGHS